MKTRFRLVPNRCRVKNYRLFVEPVNFVPFRCLNHRSGQIPVKSPRVKCPRFPKLKRGETPVPNALSVTVPIRGSLVVCLLCPTVCYIEVVVEAFGGRYNWNEVPTVGDECCKMACRACVKRKCQHLVNLMNDAAPGPDRHAC